jgi:glycosyltransferase involved in cell wall biosynthesis
VTDYLLSHLPWRLRKSAGVAVTPRVHRCIADGNESRSARDWAAAAAAYRAALDEDPALGHIWVQLGHMLKEQTDLEGAEAAYRAAIALAEEDADAWLHLGHVLKLQGARVSANQAYLQALRRDPGNADAMREIGRLLGDGEEAQITELIALLGPMAEDETCEPAGSLDHAFHQLHHALRMLPEVDRLVAREQVDALSALVRRQQAPREATCEAQDLAPALVFDVSDLISYFRNARLPTGIQRVQIETISGALALDGLTVQICAFLESRDDWLEIPANTFRTLARLSLSGGDRGAPEWLAALARLHLRLATAAPIDMPRGAYLINLGTSWWLQNYFLFVRQAKELRGVRYVPFVHDLIPVMAGEHCVTELTQDFVSWAIGAFDHADHFLVNSESTKRDLLQVATLLGHQLAAEDIVVVRLDGDCRKPDLVPAPIRQLGRWGLIAGDFVLFVSTIESRKNHLLAFEAWIALLKRYGAARVPKLVCVGNRGWLNDAVYARLEHHEGLRSQVVMLSGLSDAELALLYRSCRFTLYPSQYEGWGLPVTESLCHGKVPLLSDASSLPEAGGEFAVYFRSGDGSALLSALERLLRDDGYRETLERRIASDFVPRPWQAITTDIVQAAQRWQARDRTDVRSRLPRARLGAWHPFTRSKATRLWRGMASAEVFRAGDGWWQLDDWGCWTKPQGGRLVLGTGAPGMPMRLHLQLHGIPRRDLRYGIAVENGTQSLEGTLAADAYRWVSMTTMPDAEGAIRLRITGSTSTDLAEVTDGGDPRLASVGVTGFFLSAADDEQARLAFVEAITLGTLADISYGAEPISAWRHATGDRSGREIPAALYAVE